MDAREFYDLVSEWSRLKREAEAKQVVMSNTNSNHLQAEAERAAYVASLLEIEIHEVVDRTEILIKKKGL